MTSLYLGDCLEVLRTLPAGSVQCAVTSPPYWGLRDYGTARWEGGDPACEHREGNQVQDNKAPGAIVTGVRPGVDARTCRKCGARRVDRQVGMEKTPGEYVARLVEVFEEVRRVLRDDGTLWLNLGDSYASGKGSCFNPGGGADSLGQERKTAGAHPLDRGSVRSLRESDLKPKDLVGIPWRVAFALQEAGWWLRSDIVWAKPNPMPESVRDRPTKAHEYIFLLAKSARYFFDSEAVKEAGTTGAWKAMPPIGGVKQTQGNDNPTYSGNRPASNGTRNVRSVWTMTTRPYPEAHFATFPETLPEKCIRAGTSERGACPHCGAPWVRVTEKGLTAHDGETASLYANGTTANRLAQLRQAARKRGIEYTDERKTTGWQPSCTCPAHEPVQCVVLDPFMGSGTTGAVALRLGRRFVGIELNQEYVRLAEKRIGKAQPMLAVGDVGD